MDFGCCQPVLRRGTALYQRVAGQVAFGPGVIAGSNLGYAVERFDVSRYQKYLTDKYSRIYGHNPAPHKRCTRRSAE